MSRSHGRSAFVIAMEYARLGGQILTSFGRDELCLFTATRDGNPLSFMLFGQDGDRWTALLTGTGYDKPHSRLPTSHERSTMVAP